MRSSLGTKAIEKLNILDGVLAMSPDRRTLLSPDLGHQDFVSAFRSLNNFACVCCTKIFGDEQGVK